MSEERGEDPGDTIAPSPVFTEATQRFNAWLVALDAVVTARSAAAAEAAQTATAALLAHLDAHPDAPELAPVRARLVVVFDRLRQEETGAAG